MAEEWQSQPEPEPNFDTEIQQLALKTRVASAKRTFEDSRKRFIGLGPAQRQMQSLQRASLNSLRTF